MPVNIDSTEYLLGPISTREEHMKCPHCTQTIREKIYRLHVVSCGELKSLFGKILR